ncbi:MAG: hypothetical protein WC802_05785 [Patescibacteria group bacterium]
MASLISLGQVIDKTIFHYKKHFLELVSITAWIVVAAVPAALAKLLAPFAQGTGTETTTPQLLLSLLNDAGAILLGVVSAWALITVIIAVSEEASGAPRDIKARSKKAWKLFFSYLWISILLVLISSVILIPPVAGFALVFIDTLRGTTTVLSSVGGVLMLFGTLVSFILLVRYTIQYGFAPYSLILDDKRGTKALKHSSDLVTGRWWATFFRFVLPKVLYSLVVIVLNFVLLAALAIFLMIVLGETLTTQGVGNAVWFLLSTAITALMVPLIAVTDYHIYDSLRSSRS